MIPGLNSRQNVFSPIFYSLPPRSSHQSVNIDQYLRIFLKKVICALFRHSFSLARLIFFTLHYNLFLEN